MKIIFYQANFCAECGNATKPRPGWGPRYFCADCEAHIGRPNYFKPAAGLLLCAALALLALNKTETPNPNAQSNAIAAVSSVSARDTVTARSLEPESDAIERVLCGARTKKGTPCKRLVLPGQRCAQHRGMASLLDNSTSTKEAKSAR